MAEKRKYGPKKDIKRGPKKENSGDRKFTPKSVSKAGINGGSRYVKKQVADVDTKKSRCPYFKKCGACQMIDTPYDKQLRQKHAHVQELLEPYTRVASFVGMEEPEHYRCKVHAVFTHDKKGNPLSGIYREGTHEVV
ncbi:MAG: 23S rRNA (uracil(1939)-C(5))-methyltransferase RlmD, partial [Butyrivibrio sp.]|nr:23S rRNA (uracil(1939)-C(5))-methyltransferase RlmD [Butyrivibrio sp.]